MATSASAKRGKPAAGADTVELRRPKDEAGTLKDIGGSHSNVFNSVLAKQTLHALWVPNGSDEDGLNKKRQAALAGLLGIGPKDELEGMLAGQLIACHSASMECYRRAMIPDQTFEGRKENLTQANTLSRTYSTLLEALNRHRGKGQQKVTVEHVTVHQGGQAIVGAVETGGGVSRGNEGQPHAKALSHAPVAPLWSEDQEREPVPVTCDGERPLSNARRPFTGRAAG